VWLRSLVIPDKQRPGYRACPDIDPLRDPESSLDDPTIGTCNWIPAFAGMTES
jgi:hypothetical protein